MHELLSTLLLAAALLQTGTPQARPSPAQAQASSAGSLEKAEALIQAQQYAQAEEKLQALTATQGKNAQLWFDLGYCESHQNKTAEAVTSYRKAVDLAPNWFEANLNLGVALAKSGDHAGAAAVLRHATGLNPLSGGQQAMSKAWESLARVLEESDPKASAAAYEKAAELDPADAAAHLGAARMAERSGNSVAAEQQYIKLAEAGNTEAVERLVNLYLGQKKFTHAETWLRKSLAANPNNAVAQAQLGKLLAAQGNTQEAIAALEAAYKAAPDRDLARALAGLYLEAKQFDSASALLQELVAQGSNDAQLHFDYGSALLHQHKYPEAQAELIKAVQLKPGLVEAYFDLAYAAQQNKEYQLVIRVLDARAKLQPETPATYFLRAEALDSLKLYKPAAENYKLFLAAANGKYPDQEFQARHRLKAIEPQ